MRSRSPGAIASIGDLFEAAVRVAVGRARHAREERRHLAPRAPLGIAFEELAAGIHQRHDDAGERLAEGERGAHRRARR